MLNIGEKITQLRKTKSWSQTDLAKAIDASREAIGKYERNEVIPSVEVAKKIADVFDVTLDYLVNDQAKPAFDKKVVQRIMSIEALKEDDKGHLFAMIDAYLRDAKTRLAYGS
jgi:transcriptional regulator with XRE-family HTH domain